MGSFANSLHVKCQNDGQVAGAIREILTAQGFQPTERAPEAGVNRLSSLIHGLHISAPAGGWVSVLDSDLGNADVLTSGLAKRLHTHAIYVLVNDSDAWSYLLADPTGKLSEFDSLPEDDEDFDEQSLGQLNEAANAALRLQSMMRDPAQLQRLQQLNAQMMAAAPPDIQELQARMQRGQFNMGDMQRYQAWSREQMPKFLAQLDPALEQVLGGRAGSATQRTRRKQSKAQRAAEQNRVDTLRPLLAHGVTDEQVRDVFGKQAVFAEELLAEFLPLLGISPAYAHLSYSYLDETTPAELSADGIRFVHNLRFQSGPPIRIFPGT